MYSGFIKANFGMSMSLSTPSFNKPFDKIAAFDVSEPLAGIVVMTPIGSALSGFAFPEKKSQQSPSYGIPRAIACAAPAYREYKIYRVLFSEV